MRCIRVSAMNFRCYSSCNRIRTFAYIWVRLNFIDSHPGAHGNVRLLCTFTAWKSVAKRVNVPWFDCSNIALAPSYIAAHEAWTRIGIAPSTMCALAFMDYKSPFIASRESIKLSPTRCCRIRCLHHFSQYPHEIIIIIAFFFPFFFAFSVIIIRNSPQIFMFFARNFCRNLFYLSRLMMIHNASDLLYTHGA